MNEFGVIGQPIKTNHLIHLARSLERTEKLIIGCRAEFFERHLSLSLFSKSFTDWVTTIPKYRNKVKKTTGKERREIMLRNIPKDTSQRKGSRRYVGNCGLD